MLKFFYNYNYFQNEVFYTVQCKRHSGTNFQSGANRNEKKQFVFGLALGVSGVKVIRRVQPKRGRTEVLSELCS